MTKYLLKITSIFSKAKGKYGVIVYILFPLIIGYKLTRKIYIFMREALEYGQYLFLESNKYNTDYLKKITGFSNEDDLLKTIKKKNHLLMCCITDDENDFYNKHFNKERSEIIDHADMVCEHIFDLMGSGPTKINIKGNDSKLIDWQLDFTGGYGWNSKTFWKWIKYGKVKGADIIVPFELSRFQDRMALAQAFKLTKDHRYADEFQDQVIDWIDNNKFGFGINWFCTMDIAIRAANWLVIKELFNTGYDFPETFLIKMYGSLYDHGRFIRNHLQRLNGVTTNHYISGLVGLLCIAVYCPFFIKSKEWLGFAVKELETEIEKQVYPDGCDYEASTSYHLLVLEMLFYALLIGERAGVSFSDSYRAKVKKMFEASLYFIKLDGQVPQIGDNDNGRLFKLSKRPVNEHRYLLSLAAIYFDDGNFKLRHFDIDEEAFWIFGGNIKEVWDSLPYREDEIKSKSFPDAGWYIIRRNKDYCFISCGPTGQGGKGGHAHNDKLSFELMLDGQDIIVDPGVYVYTPYPKIRNKFRSTEYHNTIKFSGYEQNEIPDRDMFSLHDRVEIKKAELSENDGKINFQGEIQYADVTHKRIITLNKESGDWRIEDIFSCLRPVNAKLMFHLSPGLTFDGNNLIALDKGNKIASISVDGHQLIKEEYDYSPEYGVKLTAEKLVVYIPVTESNQKIITKIYKK